MRIVQTRVRCRECGSVVTKEGATCFCARLSLTARGPTLDPVHPGLGFEDLSIRGGLALVVGECPPRAGLAPGETAAFDRMASSMGVSRAEFDRLFDVTNVFDGPQKRWSADRARQRATLLSWKVCRQAQGHYAAVFLLGRRVAEAFGCDGKPLLEISVPEVSVEAFRLCEARLGWVPRVRLLPHPSGRSRWWNEPANREDFRATMDAWLRSVGER